MIRLPVFAGVDIEAGEPAARVVRSRVDTDGVSDADGTPAGLTGVAPGLYARLWLPVPGGAGATRLSVPRSAIVRRAEMTGLYVLDAGGKPLLRQVRLGPVSGHGVLVTDPERWGPATVAVVEIGAGPVEAQPVEPGGPEFGFEALTE